MSFGINGADPFKSYATSSNAGGGLTGYRKRRKKNKDEGVENQLLDSDDEQDVELDFDDEDFDF